MQIAVIGVGVMGEAILRSAVAAVGAENVVIAEGRAERAEQVRAQYGVRLATSAEAVVGADAVVIGVKPNEVLALLAELSDKLSRDTVVISIAAGLTTDQLGSALRPGTPVVRVMPNTPALVGFGMAAISGGQHTEGEHLALAEKLLAQTGKVVQVPESQQDAVTAISGSGPAYAFYLIDAMAEAGVMGGLTRELATELAVQTVRGAAELVAQSGDHPAVLRERVSSPGGTTVAAIAELDNRGVRAAVVAAAETARKKAAQLRQ